MLDEQYGLGEDGEAVAAVDTLLQEAAGETVASQTTVVVQEPAQPVWEMTIYSGGEATTTEVIDETVVDEPVAPVAESPKKGSIWKGLIGTYFGGA